MKARAVKLPLTTAEIETLAVGLMIGHASLVAEGYTLGAGSRCWESRRGMTARLVYRQRDIEATGVATITMIVKGIPVAHG